MVHPEAPTTRPDPARRLARAGFVCGLGVLAATALAVLAIYGRLLPAMTSGEGALLVIATFPFAVLGSVLSVLGCRSISRRGLAIAGMLCCLVYNALVVFEAFVLYQLGQVCAQQVDGCY
jgi:hypothetical protein